MTDKSPWGEMGHFPEPDPPSTQELLVELAEETRERIDTDRTDKALWERYANRLAADGTLIR